MIFFRLGHLNSKLNKGMPATQPAVWHKRRNSAENEVEN